MEGIIIKGIGGFYYIETADGIYECKARGIFRKEKITPLAGDRCRIQTMADFKGNIEEILPRKNSFVRPPVANVDTMIIVFAAASPAPVPELIDKLSVIALSSGVTPAIVINKTDLDKALADELLKAYEPTGFDVFSVSAKTGEGIDALREYLKGKISVFAGCSGVGKSSVLNCVLPDAELKTGRVSEKIQRGRHTTRDVTLISAGFGGYIADTPGFSSLEIENITADELAGFFPEFEPYKYDCRFRGCSHVNEPDCCVKNAVAEGKIGTSRYESYKQLYSVLKEIKQWKK
ncbi:MAG: ribosome small subunit-dependent GTPase A [Clostridia bacterium]|nr:ribosome small subunit-dependent GTPase A [Clostridia bacterium]MBR2973867.1 ribosome small subunit-dependent GTPase A [Clostridia bacterium]